MPPCKAPGRKIGLRLDQIHSLGFDRGWRERGEDRWGREAGSQLRIRVKRGWRRPGVLTWTLWWLPKGPGPPGGGGYPTPAGRHAGSWWKPMTEALPRNCPWRQDVAWFQVKPLGRAPHIQGLVTARVAKAWTPGLDPITSGNAACILMHCRIQHQAPQGHFLGFFQSPLPAVRRGPGKNLTPQPP